MKKKTDPPKGKAEEGGGLLMPILYAALGGIGGFLVILFIGIGIGAFNTQGQVAEQPSAQSSYRGTLPTQKPTRDPAQTPAPEETDGPVETEHDAQTREPSNPPAEPTKAPESTQEMSGQTSPPVSTRAPSRPAQTQKPGPVVSVRPAVPTAPPAQHTQKPAQSGNQGGTGAGDRAAKFAAGQVLATTASNNDDDPVYHTTNCRSAQRIAASDEYWYSSAQDAINDGRRICGNCNR